MVYAHTKEYYSATKTEILTMLQHSEPLGHDAMLIIQAQKDKWCIIPFIKGAKVVTFIEKENRMFRVGGMEVRRMGSLLKMSAELLSYLG